MELVCLIVLLLMPLWLIVLGLKGGLRLWRLSADQPPGPHHAALAGRVADRAGAKHDHRGTNLYELH
ncbi:MAG TPA: hypothetical protein VD886_04925 [Herpetosiphonaceae bacterium]|nr:hypothetical protein [Herpetosiphonaceae bacterium]